jgi:hypothetical protein
MTLHVPRPFAIDDRAALFAAADAGDVAAATRH